MAYAKKTISAVGSHGWHTFTMTVEEKTVNTSANTSTVNVLFTIKPKVSGYDWEEYTSNPPHGTVYFAGNDWSWSLSDYDGRSTKTLVNKTVTVTHDTDGSKTITGTSSNNQFRFACSSLSDYYLPGSASAYGSITLTKITRAATVTVSNTSKTETSITNKWTSDLTASKVEYRYSSNSGSTWSSWTSKTVSAKSGSYTISGLSANTSYQIQTRITPSGITTTTTASNTVKTYAWPYASCPTTSVYKQDLDITLVNPLRRRCKVTIRVGSTVIFSDTDVVENLMLDASGYREAFLVTIPNSASGTYSVDVEYGSHKTTKTGTFNATGANPSIGSVTYTDTNTTAQAIIQNDKMILQNVSTPRFTIVDAALYDATIVERKVTILNVSSTSTGTSVDFGTINSATNVSALITVKDSRGNTATKSVTVTMAAYTLPSALITLKRKNNYYSLTDLTVDANVMQLGSNTPTITARWKEKGTSAWSNPQTIQDNTQTALNGSTGLDNTKAWDVQITVTDSFGGTTTYNSGVGIGLPILYIDRTLRAVGIDGFPTEANQLLVNGNISSLPKRFTPTKVSVSGITLASLQVYVSAGWCAVTIELTSTTTLSGWTTIASGMPLPAMDWYDTMESWATTYKRPFRVQVNDSNGNLNIRYGDSSSYRISFVYPLADLQ